MAVYNQNQLISASNATYTTNGANEITAAAVRSLNNSWVSSSALISGSNTFYNDQIISGSLNVVGGITGSLFGTATSASHAVTASFALNSGGSGGSGFPFNGNAVITGSLTISGSSNYPLNVKGVYIGTGGGGIENNTTIGGQNNLFYNTSGQQNISIGSALYNNTTGNGNIALGSGTLYYNQTGINNIAIGNFARETATSGNSNVAIGEAAIRYNSGAGNTAIGLNAGLYSSGSGNSNVYLGVFAGPTSNTLESNKLYINNAFGTPLIGGDFSAKTVNISGSLNVTGSITGSLFGTATSSSYAVTASYALNGGGGGSSFPYTGNAVITGSLTISGSSDYLLNVKGVYVGRGKGSLSNNIAIGNENALYSNTTGQVNMAFGDSALLLNTTGNYNVALGLGAIALNSSGNSNIAVGYNALSKGTSVNFNVAVGPNALEYSQGTGNVAMGLQSLQYNSGDTNIAIGYYSGFYSSGSGNNNVYIGPVAGPSSNTVESNKLYINNNSGTPLIGGDFSTRVVTINNILSLTPRTTNPSNPASGSLIVSGSGADIKPYFWNGSTWTSLI